MIRRNLLCLTSLLLEILVEGTPVQKFDTIKAKAGERVELPCNTQKLSTVFWGFYLPGADDVKHVAVFGHVLNGYGRTHELHGNNLVIKTAGVSDGGLYCCIEDDGAGQRYLVFVSIVERSTLSPTIMPVGSTTSPTLSSADIGPKVEPPLTTDGEIDAKIYAVQSTDGEAEGNDSSNATLIIVLIAVVFIVLFTGGIVAYCLCKRPRPDGFKQLCVAPTEHDAVELQLLNGIGPELHPRQKKSLLGRAVSNIVHPRRPAGVHEELPAPEAEDIFTKSLPRELLESILLKSASLLYDVFRVRILPRADTCAVSTLFSVCAEWRHTIACRRWNRTQLRGLFERQNVGIPSDLRIAAVAIRDALRSQPLQPREADAAALVSLAGVCRHWSNIVVKCDFNRRQLIRLFHGPRRPQLVAQLPVKNDVCGLAHLNSRIYVACYESSAISVFSDRPPFHQYADLVLDGSRPADIAVCRDTQRLVVADSDKCVWRVDVKSPTSKPEKFLEVDYVPWSISLAGKRLLVTPHGGNSLYLYDFSAQTSSTHATDSGVNRLNLRLLNSKDVVHAVETTRGTFIVCSFTNAADGTRLSEVSKVDRRGDAELTYRGPLQPGYPQHTALMPDDRMLIAYNRDNRVVLLDAELKFDRLLLDGKRGGLRGKPARLCYAEQSRQLIVGLHGGQGVSVYHWR